MSRLFDGTDDNLFGDWGRPVSNQYTLSIWGKKSDADLAGGLVGIGLPATESATNSQFELSHAGSGIGFRTQAHYKPESGGALTSSTPVDSASTDWIHHAGTFFRDSGTGTVEIFGFKDGVKGASASMVLDLFPDPVRIWVGQRNHSSNVANLIFFPGHLSQIAIFERVLSDTEIAELAAGANPMDYDNLVAYWSNIGDADPEIDVIGGLSLAVTGTTPSEDEPLVQAPGGGGSGSFHTNIIETLTPSIARDIHIPWMDQ